MQYLFLNWHDSPTAFTDLLITKNFFLKIINQFLLVYFYFRQEAVSCTRAWLNGVGLWQTTASLTSVHSYRPAVPELSETMRLVCWLIQAVCWVGSNIVWMDGWMNGCLMTPQHPVYIGYCVFQPVLHNWCTKGYGMNYPGCGLVHIKDLLLLIGKSSPWSGSSGFHHSLCVVFSHMFYAM